MFTEIQINNLEIQTYTVFTKKMFMFLHNINNDKYCRLFSLPKPAAKNSLQNLVLVF